MSPSQAYQAGLAINPATPLDCLDHVLEKLDVVLIMSVNPGFAGQSFISEALSKLALARARIDAMVARRFLSSSEGSVATP